MRNINDEINTFLTELNIFFLTYFLNLIARKLYDLEMSMA